MSSSALLIHYYEFPRVSDPYSFDTVWIRIRIQHLGCIPIRIQGFFDQKFKKFYNSHKKNFKSKTTIYLSLVLHKGRPSYKRSLQLSKENIQHFKTWNFLIFLLLWVIFPPGSGSGFRIQIRIRIHCDLIESWSETLVSKTWCNRCMRRVRVPESRERLVKETMLRGGAHNSD